MENKTTIYLSNLKPIGENGLRGRLYLDKIIEHKQFDNNGREYIDYIINPNKNGIDEKYGTSHYMKLNTFKPKVDNFTSDF